MLTGSENYGLVGSTVRNCVFEDNAGNGTISRNHDILLENSRFVGGNVGFRQTRGKTGTVVSCVFSGNNIPVWGNLTATVVLLHCTIRPGSDTGVLLTSESHLMCSGTRIEAGGLQTLDLLERSTADFHGNDILFGQGAAVRLQLYETKVTVDLSNNYWGTTDLGLIDAKILDKEEQVGVITEVIFEPILTESVPTEKKTFGDIKSMFRGKN